MEQDISRMKYKQLICENSPELREFERKLMTAYNRQMLEVKIEAERLERKRQEALEREAAEAEKRRLRFEEERLAQEEAKKRKEELILAKTLLGQMKEKQKVAHNEKMNILHELAEVQRQTEEEKKKELLEAEEKEKLKMKLRIDQMEFIRWQSEIKETQRLHEANEQKRFTEEATYLFGRDMEEMQKRKIKIEQFEAIKLRLARQLQQLAELKQEKEEIRERLMCIEREELEQQRAEQEEMLKVRSRQLAKKIYWESQNEKKKLELVSKDDDISYANYIKKQVEADEKREEEMKQLKHKQRLVVRSENEFLINLRTARKASELAEERALIEAEEAARIQRENVVAEERIRLLSSLDPELLDLLPRGSLSEEDKLCLNTYRAMKMSK